MRQHPAHHRASRPVVLVVDDDAGVRESLRVILGDEHHVLEAADGTAALSMLATHAIDVVLLDVLMPGTDGIEVLGAMRARCPDVAVVMVTAVRVERLASEARRLGADGYITKPFDVDELLGCLRRTVERLASACAWPRHGPPSTAAPGGGITIVSADIDRSATFRLLLERFGSTSTLATPSEAWSLAAGARPACVLLDLASSAKVRAPFPAIRERFPESPIVSVTSERGQIRIAVNAVTAVIGAAEVTLSAYVGQAVEHMLAHYPESLTVNTIAECIGISASHLAHVFPADTGITVHGYLLRLRLAVATRLLSSNGHKLAVIAERTGFCDAAHLSHALRRHAGGLERRRPRSDLPG